MPLTLFETKEKVNLLIDIGNGSISAALVLYPENAKPKLLFSTTIAFPINEKPESEILIQSMEKLLNTTLTSVIKNGFAVPYFKKNSKHITSVLISFSSPWFASKIKKLHLAQESIFVVNKKFIDSLLETEIKNFGKELIGENYENSFGNELKIIENIILQTKINGYFVKENVGKKTKVFDASIYMSVISKSILNTVHKQIFKYTHAGDNNIHIHSFPLITFSVLRDLFPKNNNFFIFDITSETTDITMVINDAIVKTVSFPSGRNFIVRQIAKKFEVSTEIAESLLHIKNSNQCDPETDEKIKDALLEAENEWSIYFEDAFQDLSKENSLPGNIYITSENDVNTIYSDFIKVPKSDSTLLFRKNVRILDLNEKILSNSFETDNKFYPSVFIALLAIFYSKIGRSCEQNSLQI